MDKVILDESESIFEQEMGEVTDMMEAYEKIQEMPNPGERFYPINRAARRKAEKRNRAIRKRDPRG